MRATDALEHPSHSPPGQLQAPPNPGGRMRLTHSCSATPDRPPRSSGHPAHLCALLSRPRSQRRAAPCPRLAEGPPSSPGPTECSSHPRSSGPRAGPRRAGEVEQGEARGGRAAGDAQGARVVADAWGPTRPRSPRLRAILRRPRWEQPYVDPARVYTPLPPRRSPRRPRTD